MITFALAFAAASAASTADAASSDSQSGDDKTIIVTGQRDPASEESGGYGTRSTSTATRLSLSPRETPQSISVITRERLEDFRMDDVNLALSGTTGVNVQQVETDRTYYTARGFDIINFQVDGIGLPFAYGLQNGPLDTATYDRVEVLRGANGLLSSTGNPSATINFVRKRPGRDLAASVSALFGSYDRKRVDGDVTVPVTSDGSVRARVVGAYQDSDSYLDRYHVKRSVIYGVVEADLTPTTLLSVGYQRQDNRTRGSLWGALPLYYTDGTPTNYARSTSTAPSWAHWNVKDQQVFGDITQQLGGGWILKVSAYRHAIDEEDQLFYVYGAPDKTTGDGLYSYPGAFAGPTRDLTLDAYVSGPLSIGGREHELVIGVNRGASRLKQYSSYDYSQVGVALPGDTAFDGSFPLPDFPDYTLSADFHTRRESAYMMLRLNPMDGWHVMAGGNLTHAQSEGYSYGVDSVFERTRVTPFVGTTFDIDPTFSLYASYAKIFNPQTQIDSSYHILPPIIGDNLEGGIKAAWFDNRLNASLSIFRVHQDNTAQAAGFDPAVGQIYEPVNARSEGIEFDLSGQITPELQASAGFTALRIRGDDGSPARTFIPRKTGNASLTWSPEAVQGLKLGARMQYQSRIYIDAETTATDGSEIFIRQGAYALVDLMASYDLTEHWKVSANLNNVTNHKYLTSLYWTQAYYGAPRTASVSLGWSF